MQVEYDQMMIYADSSIEICYDNLKQTQDNHQKMMKMMQNLLTDHKPGCVEVSCTINDNIYIPQASQNQIKLIKYGGSKLLLQQLPPLQIEFYIEEPQCPYFTYELPQELKINYRNQSFIGYVESKLNLTKIIGQVSAEYFNEQNEITNLAEQFQRDQTVGVHYLNAKNYLILAHIQQLKLINQSLQFTDICIPVHQREIESNLIFILFVERAAVTYKPIEFTVDFDCMKNPLLQNNSQQGIFKKMKGDLQEDIEVASQLEQLEIQENLQSSQCQLIDPKFEHQSINYIEQQRDDSYLQLDQLNLLINKNPVKKLKSKNNDGQLKKQKQSIQKSEDVFDVLINNSKINGGELSKKQQEILEGEILSDWANFNDNPYIIKQKTHLYKKNFLKQQQFNEKYQFTK